MLPILLLTVSIAGMALFVPLSLADSNPKGLIGLGVLIVFNAITAIAMML